MSKLNIAIADDNEWTLQLFEEIVKSDHDLNIVGSARDGEGILSVIEEKEPDVVLLDIVMPKMDGLEVKSAGIKLPDHPAPDILIRREEKQRGQITV